MKTNRDAAPPLLSPPNRENIPRLALSVDDAALALAISPRTLAKLVEANEIPFVRIFRRIVLPVAGLQKWLEEQSQAQQP